MHEETTSMDEGTASRIGALPPRRLAVRLVACALMLVAADAALARLVGPAPVYEASWRAPRVLPSAALPGAIADAERASASGSRVAVFIGASPTWGDTLPDGRDALPARWAELSRADARGFRTYNLACNGQLVADTAVIARRVAPFADEIHIQLTYRTFAEPARDDATRRYPELPRLLGVPVTARDAEVSGGDPTPPGDITGAADRWLRTHWRVYGERDALAAELLGATPEDRLHSGWESLVASDEWVGDEDLTGSGLPFDELDPEQQTLIAQEWALDGSFELSPSDSELRALDLLGEQLAGMGVRATFYVAPVNIEALESFGDFDRALFARNIGLMREAVVRHGHGFADLNAETPLPIGAFSDISHTTADGTILSARRLIEATRGEVAP